MSNKSAACKFITSKTTVIPKPGKFPDVDNKSVKSDTSGTDNIEDQKYQKAAEPRRMNGLPRPFSTEWLEQQDEREREDREREEDLKENYDWEEPDTRSDAERKAAEEYDDRFPDTSPYDKDAAALMQEAIKQAGKIDAQAGNVRDGYSADYDPDEDEEYVRSSSAVVDDRYAKRPYNSHVTNADRKAAKRREELEELRSEEQYGKKDDEEKDAAAKPGDLNYAPLGPPKAQQDPNWQPPGYRNPNLNKKFRDAQTPSKKPTNNNPTGNVNAAINSNKPLTAASWRKNSSAAELTRKAIKQAASFTQYINPFNWGGNIGKSNDLDKKLKDAKKTTTPTKNLNQQLDAQKRPINAASWRKNI
jgi:hypothetical protein